MQRRLISSYRRAPAEGPRPALYGLVLARQRPAELAQTAALRMASAARRRASRPTGSISSSSSRSRVAAGFAGRPDLPGDPDSNSAMTSRGSPPLLFAGLALRLAP
jgi:hypothetical protein